MRGVLTERIKNFAENFLKRSFTQAELRLYPYIDYTIKNGGFLQNDKLDRNEISILKNLANEKHIRFERNSNGNYGIPRLGYNIELEKDFYDFINQILWLSYVSFPITERKL